MCRMLNRHFSAILMAGCCLLMACSCTKRQKEVKATEDSSQFVNLIDVVPDVILEIRYFGTYNFVGQRIDGYPSTYRFTYKSCC